MKQICVILAHPYEKSLNAAIANTAVEKLQNSGYEVKFHDLYKEKFNPILSGTELVSDESDDELLKAHQKDIANAYGIVIVHPNWWGEPPAILKGWINRVFRQGVAYDFAPEDSGGGLPIGLLKPRSPSFLTPQTRLKPEKTGSSAIRCKGFGKAVFLIFVA